jgi:putative hydrolase of the HAD superfamily
VHRLTVAIKALTLDLDDTLWASAPAIAAAEAKLHAWLEDQAPAVAAAFPPQAFAKFRRTVAAELPHIAHDFTALRHEALTRILGLHGAPAALADAGLELFIAARSAVELFPDVPQALERLAARYPLVALTNGNADVAAAGVARFFTCTVNARSAGCAKPDSRIFLSGCSSLRFEPREVMHVGDDPDLDVRGALRAGLRAAWMNREGRPWPGEPDDYEEVGDLLALCERLGA